MALIRPYAVTDMEACIDAFESNIPKFFATEELVFFKTFLTDLCDPNARAHKYTRYFVIEESGKIAGCGGFGDKDGSDIISLAWGLLHKDFHKRGLGRLLLQHRLDAIASQFPGVPLVVDTTQHTFGFFERHGFKTEKITRDYYAPGLDRYDMVFDRGI